MIITQQHIDEVVSNTAYYLERWRRYPLAFIIECCNAFEYGLPVIWQIKMMNNVRRHKKVAVRSGHGVGKTRGLAWLFWWYMICWKIPGQNLKIPCTGPTGGNLEDILWPEIGTVHSHMHKYFQDQFSVISGHARYKGEGKDSWFGSLRTARRENPDALQGFHGNPALVILEEASGIDDKIFEVGMGVLSSEHSYAVMTGNPTRLSGTFYQTFVNPSGMWYLMHVDCRNELDSQLQVYNYIDPSGDIHQLKVPGRVNQQLVDNVYATYGESSPEADVRVRGNFPTSETSSIVRREWVTEPKINYDREWLEPHAKRIMGVDPADVSTTEDSGDESACVIRLGRNIEEVDGVRGYDQTQIGEWVIGKYFDLQKNNKQVHIINIDCTGVGAGTWAHIKNDPRMVKEFRNKKVKLFRVIMQESALDDSGPKCYRMRDWLWWQMRNYFQYHTQYLAHNTAKFKQLLVDVTTPLYDTKTGKVKVEQKREIRKRTGKSPDYGDALMLTFYGNDKIKEEKNRKPEKDPHRKQAEKLKHLQEANSWRIA